MPAPNASDRKSVRAQEKAARIAAQKRANVVRAVMSTYDGREWVWELLARSHCFTTTFNGDALQSAFNEGQRANGLALLADVMLTCPDAYLQAQRESNERHALDLDSDAPAQRRSGEVADGGDSGREAGADTGTEADGDETGRDGDDRPNEDDSRYDLTRFLPAKTGA